MRPVLLAIVLCPAIVAGGTGQEPQSPDKKDKLPESGDTIVVKGCLSGASILDDETGLTFRLKGEKALIKQIEKDHKGHRDEVTGILRSSLQMGGMKGKQVGRTRITIGAASRTDVGAPRQLNPVLEVTSIEHTPFVCVK